jgi:predicted house-cleaning NTP pyrophosphatase (Maf/HAM1 superfamily)
MKSKGILNVGNIYETIELYTTGWRDHVMRMCVRDSRTAQTAGNYKPRGRRAVGSPRKGSAVANLMESERVKMCVVLVADDNVSYGCETWSLPLKPEHRLKGLKEQSAKGHLRTRER